jgi:hypothetical protein
MITSPARSSSTISLVPHTTLAFDTDGLIERRGAPASIELITAGLLIWCVSRVEVAMNGA